MPMFSDEELDAYARSIGAVTESGRWTMPRPRLAAALQSAQDEVVDLPELPDAEPTTASLLAQFKTELEEAGLAQGYAQSILGHAAGALIRRYGLHTREEPAK